ncbi:hypothetical protein [Halorubellus sp. PRR65]|uniref:hypothetical protein n=1 Tax=Halorubellus sp. PRR65 TaxID=3098148 RepID=UPI002B263441|nr:hypothetical protein [Halorubellus sp. PRR65]
MFGGNDNGDDRLFDSYDAYVPSNLPDIGPVLAEHDVLTGREHAAFHRLTRAVFEERGVYDVTFGYNLARLNLDRRHEDAGYRYAVDAEDPSVLWATFTPTTEFCPQSQELTVGSYRAWNGLADRHEFDAVRVRVAGMHQHSDAINETLGDLAVAEEEGSEQADVDARTTVSRNAGDGESGGGFGAPF